MVILNANILSVSFAQPKQFSLPILFVNASVAVPLPLWKRRFVSFVHRSDVAESLSHISQSEVDGAHEPPFFFEVFLICDSEHFANEIGDNVIGRLSLSFSDEAVLPSVSMAPLTVSLSRFYVTADSY
jgi:hypothetical protein